MDKSFLEKKYPDLPRSEEVESAVRRQEIRTDKKVSGSPEKRLEAYLDRLSSIFRDPDPAKRQQRIEVLKRKLHQLFVIKPQEISESYFDLQKRIAREQGHGDIEITPELREQATEIIINDQQKSLDAWIDYLGSSNTPYPDWFKYFTFRNIVKLSEYDKEKKEFRKRSKGTTAFFPDINREALSYVYDQLHQVHETKEKLTDPELQKLFEQANFAKLYAHAIEKVTPASEEQKEITKGKWVKYEQGSDSKILYQSLQGQGTGWCTAGEGVAETQLKTGDFYVYYTQDKSGNITIPRIAIRMQESQIAEVRGINQEQNLEPNMIEIAQEKMKTLPGAEQYEKKVADMKQLTKIDKKIKANQQLTKSDLIFLYEINEQIQGFGYQRDPRIEEVRETRDIKQDAPIVFDCEPNQIAYKKEDINKNTKAYIGPLFKGIFQTNLEHVYTKFPEGRIKRMETTIGGKTKNELIKELKAKNINISSYAEDMLKSNDFTTSKKSEQIKLVRLTVEDLGLKDGATTDETYQRARELGLELCPAETGPHLRLQYKSQPMYEWLNIGMKQISDSGGYPSVFGLRRYTAGLWLHGPWASPENGWHSGGEFVFRLRKLRNLES